MPKLKTNKAIAKRIRITKKNKKVKIKAGGQDHFNARESGNTTRNKRRHRDLDKSFVKNIKRLLPYN